MESDANYYRRFYLIRRIYEDIDRALDLRGWTEIDKQLLREARAKIISTDLMGEDD